MINKKTIYLFIKAIANRSGGAERVVVNLANELNRAGYIVTILTYDKSFGMPFYCLDSNVNFFNLYPRHRKAGNTRPERLLKKSARLINDNISGVLSPNYFKTVRSLSNRLEWFGNNGVFLNNLTSYLKSYPPSVLISFLPSAFSVCQLACDKANVKHIVSEHNVPKQDFSNPDRWDPNPYDIKLRWKAVEKSNAVTVLFDEFKEWFPNDLHSKIKVITNFVEFPEKINLKPYIERRKRIIAVGRLADVKNHEVLIKAWKLIQSEFKDWEVEIYGDGPLYGKLNTLINDLEVDNCYLRGVSGNVWELYADSQIFCIPSKFEGFGLVTVEALIAGLPSIGFSGCNGTNQIIKPSINGELVEDFTAESLANTLLELINNQAKREAYSKNASPSIERFNKSKIIPKWLHLIESL
ncbi:glycosyltransferase [Psychrobacter alimentarius]|uniref:glycosyltransferase n=1 Tax=Psychrobacter alimentarius TaxID=261164 RepID=UPI003FD559BA